MSERLIVPEVFFKWTIKPIFDALHWMAKTTEGCIQVYDGSASLYLDAVVDSLNRPIPMERVELFLDVIMPEIQHKVDREDVAAEPKLEQIDVLPPLEPRMFLSNVLPFFDHVGWTVEYELNEGGGVIVTGLVNGGGNQVADALVAANVRQAFPEGIPGPPAAIEYEPVEGGFDHDWNAIDFSEIRKDPANVEYLKEYASVKLIVSSRSMLNIGKDGFRLRGWVYTGSIRGQNIEIHAVLDKLNIVVPVKSVFEALHELGIDVESASPIPRPGWTRVEMDLESDEIESERQAPNVVAVEDGENSAEFPETGLVLEPEEKMGISFDYSEDTKIARVTLEIGTNEIPVHCTSGQAVMFLLENAREGSQLLEKLAKLLAESLVGANNDNEEEAKSHGESREEDAQGADH